MERLYKPQHNGAHVAACQVSGRCVRVQFSPVVLGQDRGTERDVFVSGVPPRRWPNRPINSVGDSEVLVAPLTPRHECQLLT